MQRPFDVYNTTLPRTHTYIRHTHVRARHHRMAHRRPSQQRPFVVYNTTLPSTHTYIRKRIHSRTRTTSYAWRIDRRPSHSSTMQIWPFDA